MEGIRNDGVLNQNVTHAIFIDLKKVLCTVSNDIFLKNAENCNLRGYIQGLLKVKLKHRSQGAK